MPKTPKKKPMSKAAAAALKAMENMVIKTADLDVHIEQVTERLKAAGIGSDVGSIAYAGRASSGSGQVQVNISSGGFASTWPEWAFGVAEGALHFNKKVWVIYNSLQSRRRTVRGSPVARTRFKVLTCLKRFGAGAWAIGFNEQIFGADEQVPGRWQSD